MKINSKKLLSIRDLTIEELDFLFKLTADLKTGKLKDFFPLKGKSIGLIFQKPSNRTRVSFEVGIYHLGGHSIYLRPEDIELGKREKVSDVAKVLARYLDGIVIRTFLHSDIVEISVNAKVPVVNALSDLFHPCQVLADIFTIKERRDIASQKIIFVGDGNNVCNSWILAAAKLDLDLTVACPKQYEPKKEILAMAREISNGNKNSVKIINDPFEAVKDADVIYTDVWVSMGQERSASEKKDAFDSFQVNKKLVSFASKDVLIMHCLPAHRGEEITDEVMDGPKSIVYDQAENRLHVQKAVLGMLY